VKPVLLSCEIKVTLVEQVTDRCGFRHDVKTLHDASTLCTDAFYFVVKVIDGHEYDSLGLNDSPRPKAMLMHRGYIRAIQSQ